MALVAYDEPPAPQLGERYGDLVESLTDLARALTETESVRDTPAEHPRARAPLDPGMPRGQHHGA